MQAYCMRAARKWGLRREGCLQDPKQKGSHLKDCIQTHQSQGPSTLPPFSPSQIPSSIVVTEGLNAPGSPPSSTLNWLQACPPIFNVLNPPNLLWEAPPPPTDGWSALPRSLSPSPAQFPPPPRPAPILWEKFSSMEALDDSIIRSREMALERLMISWQQ